MSPYILNNLFFAHCKRSAEIGLTLWGGDPESKRVFKLHKQKL